MVGLEPPAGAPGNSSRRARSARVRRAGPRTAGQPGAATRTVLLITLAVIPTAAAVFLHLSVPRPACTPGYGPHGRVASLFYSNCPAFSGLRGLSHVPQARATFAVIEI